MANCPSKLISRIYLVGKTAATGGKAVKKKGKKERWKLKQKKREKKERS